MCVVVAVAVAAECIMHTHKYIHIKQNKYDDIDAKTNK